ncbi:MAG: glycosyl hydrolase [Ferruginibacter sp.]
MAQRIWQKLTIPSYSEMAAQFSNYPVEYAETLTWGWDGVATRETIAHDLDAIKKQGLHVVTIECGYDMGVAYLSAGWFEKVKIAVEEAKKRNMRIWIIDEGKYPSGFAGGKFSREKPELRMQGIEIAGKVNAAAGENISTDLDPSIISAVAVSKENKTTEIIDVSSGKLNWKAPQGNWEIILARHRFKTSVTRAANNVTHGKDTVNSLCDYLDAEATRQFLEFTHVQYQKYIGDEFGKTILGFRGDEPEFNFTPWTPKIISIFKEKKGYDIIPYIASFFTALANEKQKLAKADYWDVWSDLFRDNFFKVQADWCKANNMEYIVHIDHEDKLMDLARTEGDYFKDMRFVDVPGVDAIWNQIWYDKVADFPKLASSAAHMYGRPRALSESFAAYNPKPSVEDARWVINYELVRGINLFEFMFWPASASGRSIPSGYLSDSLFPVLAAYSNRSSFLLSNGKPAAQIGLYMPTESMWLNNEKSNSGLLKIAKQLSEKQLDFDFVDEQGIGSAFTMQNGAFKNLSGQMYSAIIIPSVTVLSEKVVSRLQEFKKSGGTVIFSGSLPSLISGRTFLDAQTSTSLKWTVHYENDSLPADAINKLPADVVLDGDYPSVKYLHRQWKDAALYFFFNEGEKNISTSAILSGKGKIEIWDPKIAAIISLKADIADKGKIQVPLKLNAHETKFIIIK